MATPVDLSIVIVNWNSREFLRKCLTSIHKGAIGITHEVIVVDNASFDGSHEMIVREFPWVRFIQSEKNLGFSRGNNLGVEYASGRLLLFLNPDTEIVGSALQTLIAIADNHPEVGIVGARLLNSDLTLQMESVRAFPSLANQILESHYLKSRFPRLSIWGMRPLFDDSIDPAPVDVVSGACLLIKRRVFQDVGGFSTQYFMYSEDVDLCHKVRTAGWTTIFVRTAEVIHHGGQSSSLSPVSEFAAVLIRESRFRFLRLAKGTAYAIAYRVITAMNAVFRLAVLCVMFPVFQALRKTTPDKTIGKWVKIFRWCLGFEPWVKTLG